MIYDKINVLDHGYVELIDRMGSDEKICSAARMSYTSNNEKTFTDAENRRLLRYLLRNAHTSPFEMAELQFRVKAPIFVARQWLRHRTANVNEASGRYSILPTDTYLPDTLRVRTQSKDNKQGSSTEIHENVECILQTIGTSFDESAATYNWLNQEGIAKELSRIVLPLSTYTDFVWKIDLHNFMHFCRLRMDYHAQEEIRVYAQAMYDIAKKYYPMVMEAFDDYILHAKRFSRQEIEVLLDTLGPEGVQKAIEAFGSVVESKTELREFESKLR